MTRFILMSKCSSFATTCCIFMSLARISLSEKLLSHRQQQHRRDRENEIDLYDYCFSQPQDVFDSLCEDFSYDNLLESRPPAHCEPIVGYYKENVSIADDILDSLTSFMETEQYSDSSYYVCLTWIATFMNEPENKSYQLPADNEVKQKSDLSKLFATELKLSPFDPPKGCFDKKNKKEKSKKKDKKDKNSNNPDLCEEWKKQYPLIPLKPDKCSQVSCYSFDDYAYDDDYYNDCKAWCEDVKQKIATAPPSVAYSSSPSLEHTSPPSLEHTSSPSIEHTSSPSTAYTSSPSTAYTSSPSTKQTSSSYTKQTSSPSIKHSSSPSIKHTSSPSSAYTKTPSAGHTVSPSVTNEGAVKLQPDSFSDPFDIDFGEIPIGHNGGFGVGIPTKDPTTPPSKFPTKLPTKSPTLAPTKAPTDSPTEKVAKPNPIIQNDIAMPAEQISTQLYDGPITSYKLPYFIFDVYVDPLTTGELNDSKLFAIFESYLDSHYKEKFHNPSVLYFTSVMRRSFHYDAFPYLYKHQFTGTIFFATETESNIPKTREIVRSTLDAFSGPEFLRTVRIISNDDILANITSVSVLEERQKLPRMEDMQGGDIKPSALSSGSSSDGVIISSVFIAASVAALAITVSYYKWLSWKRQSYYDEGRDVLHSEIIDNTFEMEDGEESGYYRSHIESSDNLYPEFL